MAKKFLPKPTERELSILGILWRKGPCTVREVYEQLDDGTGYTTALKLMQIMNGKGLLDRDEGQRTHLYQASVPEAETQKHLVRGLLDHVFGGSSKKLVMHALSAKKATRKELAEIRELLDKMEGRKS